MEAGVGTLARQAYGILVVDDERTLRFALKEGLAEDGYRVETAGAGAEALAALERGEFHLVLLDQKLPDVSGLEVLKQIKAKRPETQVVIMTAYGKFQWAVEATKAGCFDYCSFGAVVVVYPEAVWYGGVNAEDVAEIVDSHLVGGVPVERLRMPDIPGE